MKKTVFITGASSGIGRELAKCFAARGYDVLLLARRQDKLEELQRELKESYGVFCDYMLQDLRKLEDVYEQIPWSKLDVFVNCAGLAHLGDYEDLTWQEEEDMLRVNAIAPIYLSKCFVKEHSKSKKEKTLINIVSTAALYLHPFLATYSASKVSLLYYSFALEEEVRRKNKEIQVFTFCPGPTSTDLFSKEIQERFAKEKKYEMTAESVAKEIFHLWEKKKNFAIIGFRNKILMFFLGRLPRRLQLNLVGNFLSQDRK